MVQQEAVIVRNAIKRYEKELVFNGLNMTVSRGSIYGLLGASGCGKTTLLSCIVGIRYLDSGEVWVLGGNPGSKGSGIPGPQVGYMPQEISLVGEFTISGALYYFGRINGLNDEEIETRQRFLSELLQLPSANHLVKNMSGDQQRRISLAAAMVHRPELLILDEPTVGLDPILRENIWAYMIQITQEEGITVLITTHYIEETKDANKIGLMRYGKMLAELTPQKLLERFQCSSLEETFLKLCKAQDNKASLNAQECEVEDIDSGVSYQNQNQYERTKVILEYKAISERKVSRLRRFIALLAKNGNQFLHFYGGLIYAILFPIIQISIFITAIGKDPKGLKIGVVNNEAGNCDYGSNFGNVWNDEITCHFTNLSCRFLHSFNDSIAIQEYYDNIYEASYAVQNGKLNGLMYFNQNFSEALRIRMEDVTSTKDSDLLASQIQVFLDMGDMLIGLHMQKKLFYSFLEIYENIMKDCKYSPKLADPPIRFEKPVYGTTDLNYADFLAPSFMLILIFCLANTVSTSVIITDRLEGVWNRSIVQGVRTDEILLSHILIQSIIIIIHTAMIMLLYFSIWGLECKGSILDVTILTFLMGFCGLMYGFVISIIWKNYTMANYTSIGSFVILTFLSGCIWPIEGMPKGLRWISYILPTTLPSISMRGIIYKGYSISEEQVYIGFIIVVGWILFYFIVTILGLRRKTW
ncbi:PREDICTED: ABC transporter G family member 20-like [Trachymyrmex septentrionalis]|uniref:ABC transporter G family member 20-like n=1 Tax=Trachymyrmex septentrionalis TaxID=34720 RepID=UPI00084EEBF4|nr:PREDICTED: ABC transporter G family member 20-like [Trachymyrmex septentrionalis]